MIEINRENLNLFKTLYESGETIAAISGKTGFSQSVVRARLIAMGVHQGRRKFNRFKDIRSRYYNAVTELHRNLPVNAIAKELGTSCQVVRSCLKDLGLKPMSKKDVAAMRAQEISEKARQERSRLLPEVQALFDSGQTVNAISKMMGVSRHIINSCLDDLGLDRPTVSEGNARSAALASPDARRKRAAAANLAVRVVGSSDSTRVQNSIVNCANQRYVGFGERELAAELRSRGIECVAQGAVHGYNIDILCGNLAVEVHNYTTNPIYVTQRLRRIVKLLSSGYSVCYIWLKPGELASESAINELVSFYDLTRGNPSSAGQYRVIRSNGEVYTRACAELDDLTAVFSAYSALK